MRKVRKDFEELKLEVEELRHRVHVIASRDQIAKDIYSINSKYQNRAQKDLCCIVCCMLCCPNPISSVAVAALSLMASLDFFKTSRQEQQAQQALREDELAAPRQSFMDR